MGVEEEEGGVEIGAMTRIVMPVLVVIVVVVLV
jgi:hypothetical protein